MQPWNLYGGCGFEKNTSNRVVSLICANAWHQVSRASRLRRVRVDGSAINVAKTRILATLLRNLTWNSKCVQCDLVYRHLNNSTHLWISDHVRSVGLPLHPQERRREKLQMESWQILLGQRLTIYWSHESSHFLEKIDHSSSIQVKVKVSIPSMILEIPRCRKRTLFYSRGSRYYLISKSVFSKLRVLLDNGHFS